MARSGAHGCVRKDGHVVREVSETSKEEKEQRDALGAFASVVEKELWHSGSEVEHGAEVSKDLAQGVELELGRSFVLDVAVAVGPVVADPPPQNAGGAHEEDGKNVEDGRLERAGGLQGTRRGGRVGRLGRVDEWDDGRQVASVDGRVSVLVLHLRPQSRDPVLVPGRRLCD